MRNLRLIFLLSFLSTCIAAQAAVRRELPRVPVTDTQIRLPLGLYLEVLEDPTKSLTLGSVLSDSLSERFTRGKSEVPSFGFTSSAYWMRFTLKNSAPTSRTFFLECGYSAIDKIDLYTYRFNPAADTLAVAASQFTHRAAGDLLPFSRRELKHRNFIFVETLAPGEEQVYYFRFESASSSMTLPLTLWSEREFFRADHEEQIVLGFYYGMMLVMVLYNLFLFFATRDTSYLFYVLFIASFVVYPLSLNGVAFEYLWPQSIWLENVSLALSASLAVMWGGVFARKFLSMKTYSTVLDRITLAVTVLGGLSAAASLFVSYATAIRLAAALGMTICIVLIAAASVSVRRGSRPAIYFLTAWIFLLVGITLTSLRSFGLIPTTPVTLYSFQIGSAAEVVLLSLGLADRIATLRRAKETAETDAKLKQVESELQRTGAEVERLRNTELSRANAALHEASQLKSELLGIAAHDLKNPLQSIKGFSRLIEEQHKNPSDVKNYASSVSAASERMLSIVNRLLDTAAIDSGKLTLVKSEINLELLIRSVIDANRQQAKAKSIALNFETAFSGKPAISGDVARLGEAVDNLISNAVKYSPPGKNIYMTLRDAGDCLRFEIKDEGPGLTQDDMRRIFGRFERLSAKPTGGESSTGLGLSIAKQFIDLHGGKIWAESTSGNGSTFFIELEKLPLAPLI